MRILRRYILGEVFSHALLGTALFTFVIFMRDLGRLLDIVVRNSAPLPSVAEIFFLTLPTAFTVTIPMGVLVGILIGLSRMAADSEVTAIRSSGLGSAFFARNVAIFAIVAWLVALVNSVWIAPQSTAALGRLQDRLKSSQASFEVQPRVFYEDLKNMVLYVEDVKPAVGAALWRGVFLADISTPSSPKITLAQEGVVLNEGTDRIRLHLTNGSQQENNAKDPSQYSISTFTETDIPIQVPTPEAKKDEFAPVAEMSTKELWYRSQHPEVNNAPPRPGLQNDTPAVRARWYAVEFHRRLALPTSCLVLMLVGVPLGLSSKRGGKSMGFVLTILLVFLYYFVSLSGISLGRSGKIAAGPAVWMANALFAIAGVWLLYRVDRAPIEIGSLKSLFASLKGRMTNRVANGCTREARGDSGSAFERAANRRRFFSAKFPLLIDDLILRDFLVHLGIILSSFLMLTIVFTFFELLGDIVRNKISVITLGDYLINVTPSMIYLMTPLSVLIAVLITFGLMQKSNEVTAMKATGVSIYRIVFPVLVIAGVIAAGLFVFDQLYIPHANKRQETLRNQIKGKPAQTYLRPDRKWIFGEQNTIYYYEFFDPDQNRFANISAFVFDPTTFRLVQRVYAQRAHWEEDLQKWVFETGWTRSMNGDSVTNYKTFDVSTFAVLRENPSYFKKEVKQSSEMDSEELRAYIHDLQQSGFDVVRLKVQLHKKFAFPVITFIMAVLAIPFAISGARTKGALTGVAVALGIAVVYFVTAGLFEAMGNANQLPAFLAAWAPDIIFAMAGGYLVLKVQT